MLLEMVSSSLSAGVLYAAFMTRCFGPLPLSACVADCCVRRRTATKIITSATRHTMTAMAAMMEREPPPDDVLSVVVSIGGVGDSDVVAVGVTAVPVGKKAPAGDGVVVVSTGGTELVTVG